MGIQSIFSIKSAMQVKNPEGDLASNLDLFVHRSIYAAPATTRYNRANLCEGKCTYKEDLRATDELKPSHSID